MRFLTLLVPFWIAKMTLFSLNLRIAFSSQTPQTAVLSLKNFLLSIRDRQIKWVSVIIGLVRYQSNGLLSTL